MQFAIDRDHRPRQRLRGGIQSEQGQTFAVRCPVKGDQRVLAQTVPLAAVGARDFDALELAGPRWALAGDAAGLVDPITREGIFFALASGGWIAGALLAGDPAPGYTAQVRDEAISELARAARLKAGFFRPAFTGLMMRALMESGAVRSVMADLVAGRQSYASLKWRLLKTFELGLAWRALTTTNAEH